MRVHATILLRCTPEVAFDTLADVRNDTQWNSRVCSVELRSPEPVGPGARFTMVNGGTAYDVSITAYERPSRLVLEANGNPDLTIAYAFAATDGGTQVESDFDFRPKGFLKVLMPLLAPVIRRDVPKQFASLRSFCER